MPIAQQPINWRTTANGFNRDGFRHMHLSLIPLSSYGRKPNTQTCVTGFPTTSMMSTLMYNNF
jgi:hypothetical protein